MASRLKARQTSLGRDLPEQEIVDLFRSGKYSMQDLATRFKCDRHRTIRRILSKYFTDNEFSRMGRRAGAQKHSGYKHRQYKPIPGNEVLCAYLGGKSRTDLAKQYQVSQDKIQSTLRQRLTPEEMKANRYRLASARLRGKISTPGGQWKLAWGQMTRIVRERDGGKCRVCSSTSRLTSHHLLPKALDSRQVLWLANDNVVTLCRACHGKIEPKGWKTVPNALGFKEYYDACGLYLSERRVIGLLSMIAKQNSVAV